MYKCLLVLLTVVGMATATFAQQKQDMNSKQSALCLVNPYIVLLYAS